MHCYLVTILYLCTADDRTETFTDEREAISLYEELIAQEAGKDYLRVMFLDIDTSDVMTPVARRCWTRRGLV